MFRSLDQKLRHILLLAVSLSAYCIMGLVVGSALFLQGLSTTGLPWAYVGMGIVSLPLYVGIAQIVDTVPRAQLLRVGLAIAVVALPLGYVGLHHQPQPWLYYAIYVGLYAQWILLLEVLFPSLVTDYFTTLDWNRCSTSLRMAIAVGGLLGGAVVAGLSPLFATMQFLLVLTGFAIALILQIQQLTQQLSPVPTSNSGNNFQKPFSWQAIADYPIIPFLAGSTFLWIVLYCVAEYLYLGVYQDRFGDDRTLTQFLGAIRMVNNVIPLVILYGITQPLLHRFGVVVMNLIYPLTTLAAFTGLGLRQDLTIAIAANLNNDSLDDSLNQPVQILNYNAVPYNWTGRVRAVCHGLMYSLGLTIAGGLLGVLQTVFSRDQVVALGIAGSVLFVVLNYGMGKSYLRSLLQLLRSRTVDWEQVEPGLPHLPMHYRLEVDSLLRSLHRRDQLLGVTLASRLPEPQSCLADLSSLGEKAMVNSPLYRRLSHFFTHHPHPEVTAYLLRSLPQACPLQQQLYLEALLRRKQAIPASMLDPLFMSPDPTVRALSLIAAYRLPEFPPHLATELTQLPIPARLKALQVIRATRDRQFIPLVQQLLDDEEAVEIVRTGLETLATLAQPGERGLIPVVQREMSTFDPLIRAINMQLIGILQSPQFLFDVAIGLEHNHLSVRLWSAQALAKYGNKSLRFAKVYLTSKRPEVVSAAIATLGRVGSQPAIEILYDFLQPKFQRIATLQAWQQQFPPESGPHARRLQLILQDAQAQIVEQVWMVLKSLERDAWLQEVQGCLQIQDPRLRANAIERLASGRWRRFILPILPILEADTPPISASPDHETVTAAPRHLEPLLQAEEHWVRLGALLWWAATGHPIPAPLQTDPNPLVQRIAIALAQGLQEDLPDNDWFLRQLFFLKEASPLGCLSLDELNMINPLLNQRDFQAGDVICKPHHYNAQLAIVYQGKVELQPFNTVLHPSQVFGLLTLWDTEPWQETAIALTDCSLLTLSQMHLEQLIDCCPRILWGLAQMDEATHRYQATPLPLSGAVRPS